MKAVAMISTKYTLAPVLLGALALGACTDVGPKTQNGALIGAGAGAVLGALVDGKDGALKGAIVGTAVGAGVGYSLDKQEAELRNQLGNNVGITNTGDRLIVTLPQDILFATASTTVQPALVGDLQTLASSMQSYPNSTVQIIGHTDSDGDAAYNQQLSEGRANAVTSILQANGVPSYRLQAYGRGESQPIASNLTPQGKAQNRRVEIVILPNAS